MKVKYLINYLYQYDFYTFNLIIMKVKYLILFLLTLLILLMEILYDLSDFISFQFITEHVWYFCQQDRRCKEKYD